MTTMETKMLHERWKGARGRMAPEWRDNFEAYKCFGITYPTPKEWEIKPGAVISETANPLRTCGCGSGINVAPLDWVRRNYPGKEIWKVLIRWEWLPGVVCPYNSDGKIRCERVELVEVVKE